MRSQRTEHVLADLIELVRARTIFLERILSHSSSFQLTRADSENDKPLDQWLMKRARLFHTYELAEKRVELLSNQVLESGLKIPASIRSSIENEIHRSTRLIEDIRRADERVVAGIREEQDKILKEVIESRKLREKIHKFRSEWNGSTGEEIDAKG